MEAIFHEKQEGSLCAQHCLNALLQGSYFTAVDLAELARQLDDDERSHMAEAGVQSDDYQRFLEQPSSNFDDSGFFSIQVIQKAVKVWGLELIPFSSQDAIALQARRDPTTQQAYICNFREHWFSIRHLGNQFFNLNSLLTGPELISNTYLSMFLTQLQQEGYSIFIVLGELPESEADQLLRLVPATQPVKPRLITDNKHNAGPAPEAPGIDGDELERALQVSRQMAESEDTALQKALSMSMQDFELPFVPELTGPAASVPQPASLVGVTPGPSTSSTTSSATSSATSSTTSDATKPSPEELRQKRQAFLDRLQQQQNPAATNDNLLADDLQDECVDSQENDSQDSNEQTGPCKPSEMTEEQMIQEAIKLSMQSS